jgi:hypothetical protein
MKTEPSKRQRLMERILGTTVEFALRGPIAPHLIQEAKIMPIILDSMSNSSQHNQVQFGLHKIMAVRFDLALCFFSSGTTQKSSFLSLPFFNTYIGPLCRCGSHQFWYHDRGLREHDTKIHLAKV